MKTKYLPIKYAYLVSGQYPNFHRTGSIVGMRRRFYGARALLVRCGQWIYNVSSAPDIYNQAK
jgi:hypothetical protein